MCCAAAPPAPLASNEGKTDATLVAVEAGAGAARAAIAAVFIAMGLTGAGASSNPPSESSPPTSESNTFCATGAGAFAAGALLMATAFFGRAAAAADAAGFLALTSTTTSKRLAIHDRAGPTEARCHARAHFNFEIRRAVDEVDETVFQKIKGVSVVHVQVFFFLYFSAHGDVFLFDHVGGRAGHTFRALVLLTHFFVRRLASSLEEDEHKWPALEKGT
jgi:hypothetical protein